MPAQPQTIITDGIPPPNPNIRSFHMVMKEVVETCTHHKYFFALPNVPIKQTVVEYSPPILQDPKSTLNILPHALKIGGEVTLQRGLVRIDSGQHK